MKQHFAVLLVVVAVVFSACGPTAEPTPPPAPEPTTTLADSVDTYMNALTALEKFNGVVLVADASGILLHEAYTQYPDHNHASFVVPSRQFDIHSVSKLMARHLLLQLQQQGALRLSDQVSRFMPSFPRGDEMTIQMLLDHKTGLPRELAGVDGSTMELGRADILKLAAEQQLLFEPGSDTQYSNVGYQVLYAIVGAAAGKPFESYLFEALFKPLGMSKAGVHNAGTLTQPHSLAANHELKDGEMVQVPNFQEGDLPTARVFATAEDLLLWAQDMLNGKHTKALANGKEAIAQSGGADGVRAHVYAHTTTKRILILLANYDAMPYEQTISDLHDLLNGKTCDLPQPIARMAVPVDESVLERYVANYRFNDMPDLHLAITIDNGQLVAKQDGEVIANLQAENDSVFFETPSDAEVFEFVRSDNSEFDVLMGFRGVKIRGVRVSN